MDINKFEKYMAIVADQPLILSSAERAGILITRKEHCLCPVLPPPIGNVQKKQMIASSALLARAGRGALLMRKRGVSAGTVLCIVILDFRRHFSAHGEMNSNSGYFLSTRCGIRSTDRSPTPFIVFVNGEKLLASSFRKARGRKVEEYREEKG